MKTPSEVIALAVEHTYTLSNAKEARYRFMCIAVSYLYDMKLITKKERWKTRRTIEKSIHQMRSLEFYLESKNIDPTPEAKEKFWRENFDLPEDLEFYK